MHKGEKAMLTCKCVYAVRASDSTAVRLRKLCGG
jgi:hypothetical protein